MMMGLSFSVTAFGNVSLCLEGATNDELLRELRTRLNSSSVPAEYSIPTISCQGSIMSVRLLNENGKEAATKMSTSSSSSCTTFSNQIQNKLNGKVVAPTIIASCRGSILERRMLRQDGFIQDLADVSSSSSTQCKKEATTINQ